MRNYVRIALSMTILPEYTPCKGVLTSLLLATDDLVKAPQLGKAFTKEPRMLQRPRDIISWEASTTMSVPENRKKI